MSSSTPIDATHGPAGPTREGLHSLSDTGAGTEATSARPGSRGRAAEAAAALAGLVPAAVFALLAHEGKAAAVTLVIWLAVSLTQAVHRGHAGTGERMRADARGLAGVAVLVSVGTVAGVLGPLQARHSMAVLAVAGAATVLLHALRRRPSVARRVVLVGGQEALEAYVAAASGVGDVVAGCHVVDAGTATAVQPSLPVPTTTSLQTLPELVETVAAEAVLVLPGGAVTSDLVRELTWQFEDSRVTVGLVCPVSSVSTHRLRTSVSGAGTVLELGVPRATPAARIGKAVLDRVGAAVLLTLTAPLLAVLWAAVRIDSRGPGFFVQTRVGRDGRPFRMIKLRTMHRDAESLLAALSEENESDGVLFKIRRDPRVTRVGYWLRRSSLDELPQLFNVLRGDMSLVGPRPALPEEVAGYDAVARRRLVVNPGITGLWQVSGRSDLLWEESLRLDLYYADNWRLVDDLSIALRTVSAVTQARGAY